MTPYKPAFRRPGPTPALGQTFDEMMRWPPWVGDGIRLTFHGLTALLAWRVFREEEGFWKWFALFLFAGQGLGATLDVASILERMEGKAPEQSRIPRTPVLFPLTWPYGNGGPR